MASHLIQSKVAVILEQPLMKIALDALNLDERTSRELARAMLKNPRSAWQEQAFSIIRSHRLEGYEDSSAVDCEIVA